MMLDMKRVVLLFSAVLLTCAAPLHQNNELSNSHESQVTSRITQFKGTSGNDIIIKAPSGFGNPNKNGQSTVTVSLRDENTNVSIDVVSFIFSVNSEETSNAKLDESNEDFSNEGIQDTGAGPGKDDELNYMDNDEEVSEEGFKPTTGPEVLSSDEEMDKSEEETPNPRHDKSDEDQIHSRSSQSDTKDDPEESDPHHLKDFGTTTMSNSSRFQDKSNESDSELEHQKTKVRTDQSGRSEPSVLNYPTGQLTGLRSALVSTLIHRETTSAEANSRKTDHSLDISFVQSQTVPTNSVSMLGRFQSGSLSSSSEEETNDKCTNRVTDTTLNKIPNLNSGLDSILNTEDVKKYEVPPAPFSSGSDFYPEYVNDDWQYDPRYYDPYRNHPEYAAGYDPYAAGYDPYAAGYDPYAAGYDPYAAGYDPYAAGYDPYAAGYDPYQAGYDPYQAGYDPYGEAYDPYGAGYDPYGTKYDPYQAGYDNQDPYHETESEDPRHDVEQETTPAYSVEENESRPTEISNSQDNSLSEEQPLSPSVSPSSNPVSPPEGYKNTDFVDTMPSEEPSNSSSIETSKEMGLQSSKGLNDSNSHPDHVVTESEEDSETRADAMGKTMAVTGSSSSEESIETTDSEQESQNPKDHTENQGTSETAIQTSPQMSVIQLRHNTHEEHNEEEAQSQSTVDLIPSLSSEEDNPLVNTIEHIMAIALKGETNEKGTVVGTNPDSTPSDNTISKNNQNEESNESTTDSPGVRAEVTHESVHLFTERQTFDSESVAASDTPVSNEDAFDENTTPNPSTNLHITTQSSEGIDNSAEANANTANDSEESQESQISNIPSTVFPIPSQPRHVQTADISSDEENTLDRKYNQGKISHFLVETPAKIIATNLWTSFLQALKVPIANQRGQTIQKNVRRPQSTRRYHQRSNKRQKANSSEESK